MNTKLNIGDIVEIENREYTIKKIIIESRGIRYIVNNGIVSDKIKHLCNDEFWENDFDNGLVYIYRKD